MASTKRGGGGVGGAQNRRFAQPSLDAMYGLKKSGGAGEANTPPFAHKMIRTTLPYCEHGDDTFFTVNMDDFKKQGGWRVAQAPPSANKMIRTTLPYYCIYGDDMFFYRKHGWLSAGDSLAKNALLGCI